MVFGLRLALRIESKVSVLEFRAFEVCYIGLKGVFAPRSCIASGLRQEGHGPLEAKLPRKCALQPKRNFKRQQHNWKHWFRVSGDSGLD